MNVCVQFRYQEDVDVDVEMWAFSYNRPNCLSNSLGSRYLAKGEQYASRGPAKFIVPDSITMRPGRNLRLFGFGVSCVCTNIVRPAETSVTAMQYLLLVCFHQRSRRYTTAAEILTRDNPMRILRQSVFDSCVMWKPVQSSALIPTAKHTETPNNKGYNQICTIAIWQIKLCTYAIHILSTRNILIFTHNKSHHPTYCNQNVMCLVKSVTQFKKQKGLIMILVQF